mmetsp:Transcript_49294/g.57611  ORF Transcript_49294/g.57611 Transcript_49294/m.57611 type:complete len:207 (-) Transcript_49294:164-784(-)
MVCAVPLSHASFSSSTLVVFIGVGNCKAVEQTGESLALINFHSIPSILRLPFKYCISNTSIVQASSGVFRAHFRQSNQSWYAFSIVSNPANKPPDIKSSLTTRMLSDKVGLILSLLKKSLSGKSKEIILVGIEPSFLILHLSMSLPFTHKFSSRQFSAETFLHVRRGIKPSFISTGTFMIEFCINFSNFLNGNSLSKDGCSFTVTK